MVVVNIPLSPGSAKRGLSRLNWRLIIIVAVFILLGMSGGYLGSKLHKNQTAVDAAAVSQLQTDVKALQKDVADIKAAAATPAAAPAPVTTPAAVGVAPAADVLTNIKAATSSGNTAALEALMATTVKVIIAPTSAPGDRTPVQAVGDLAYLKTGTAPWNFALAADVLTKYQSGTYKQYFPTTALVGQSANGYVVSYQFDSAGKINGIFMAPPNTL